MDLAMVAYVEDLDFIVLPIEHMRDNKPFILSDREAEDGKPEWALRSDATCTEMLRYNRTMHGKPISLKDAIELVQGDEPPMVLTFNKRSEHYNAFFR